MHITLHTVLHVYISCKYSRYNVIVDRLRSVGLTVGCYIASLARSLVCKISISYLLPDVQCVPPVWWLYGGYLSWKTQLEWGLEKPRQIRYVIMCRVSETVVR